MLFKDTKKGREGKTYLRRQKGKVQFVLKGVVLLQ